MTANAEWIRFGEAFRAYRQRRGVTQRFMAEQMDISQTRLSDIERGTRPPLSFEELEAATGGVADDMDELLNTHLPNPCPTCGYDRRASLPPSEEPAEGGKETT